MEQNNAANDAITEEMPVKQNEMTPTANGGEARQYDRNTIYVGKKPTMAYVLAAITQFNQGEPEVHIKARGMSISKAVDVCQIVKNRFLSSAKIGKIDITTEELTSEDGRLSKVSSIDIQILK